MSLDDDDDVPGYFSPHQWHHEGSLPDGKPRLRCVRCAVLQHWPAGSMTCVRVCIAAPTLGETQPIHEGQHEGPYAVEPPRTCVACQRQYRRPTRMSKIKTCSKLCGASLRLETNRAARRRYT